MAYRCLADFVDELGQAGELARVEAEVDPRLEAAQIARVAAGPGAPALLFASIRGRQWPVVCNLLATEGRLCRALGAASLDEVAARLADLVDPARPGGWLERLKGIPQGVLSTGVAPRQARAGACQQIVRLGGDVDLSRLPALQSAADEQNPIITAAALSTADPESSRTLTARHDLQVLDANRLAVGWAAHDEHAAVLAEYRRRQQRMPLAAVLGGDPAGLLAAMAPAPPGADVASLAGLLRQKPLEMVPGRTVELPVPAEADLVIEGYIDPAEPPSEAGPWCTAAGFCRPGGLVPVMHVTALTHRANPLLPALVPGEPPNEISTISRALGRIFLPLARLVIPELVDYDLPDFAAARHWAVLSIRKTYPGQARQTAAAAWGMRQLMLAKVLVIVDADVDVRDPRQVLGAISVNLDPGRDVLFHQGPPDAGDPAAVPGQLGHRMALDATAKLPEERGAARSAAAVGPEAARLVRQRWLEYGLGPWPEA